MRETRSSGSVEGVVSNHDPYSDCDPSCAYFGSDLRLEPSDAGGALRLVGAKRETAPFIPTSWYLLDA